MKKALIAGAASAVLAAMPVVGVFAADYGTITDTLKVTIEPVCSLESGLGENTTQSPTAANGSFTKTMTAGQLDSNFGNTTLTVTCNIPTGYQLSAAFGKLDNADTDQDINFSATVDAAQNVAIWNAVKDPSGTSTKLDNGVILSSTDETPAAGTSIAIGYKVSLADNQAQGTYQGTAVYTLTATPQTVTGA